MSDDAWKADLAALIEQARCEGKWLHCHYQDLWFSPDELAAENANGKFLWGVVNWTLRDPQEKLVSLTREQIAKAAEIDRFASRVGASKVHGH